MELKFEVNQRFIIFSKPFMRWIYRILFWGALASLLSAVFMLKAVFLISFIVFFLLYYINRISMREILGRKKYFFYTLTFILLWVVSVAFNFSLFESILKEYPKEYNLPENEKIVINDSLLKSIYSTFFIILSFIVLVISFQATITKDWFDGFSIADGFKFKLKRMRYEKSKTELELLKTQLSPHLYKNLLTNIYDLVINNNRSAPDAIVNLKELMEYMLYDTNGKDKIELHKEIEFIAKLIEIRKNGLNYPNQISFHVNVPDQIKNKEVMPFVLLPFIENLFTHCNFNVDNAFAKVELNYDSNGILHYFVQNSYSETDKKRNKGGLGIPNLELRLNRFYKKKYTLSNKGKNGIFTSKLELKLF